MSDSGERARKLKDQETGIIVVAALAIGLPLYCFGATAIAQWLCGCAPLPDFAIILVATPPIALFSFFLGTQ